MKIYVPPIKCQGIKTKLVQFILENISELKYNRWIEPFMGSGVVGFNARPKNAIFADINPHLINFYNAIKNNNVNSSIAKLFLIEEGKKLENKGQEYYIEVRERFNRTNESLDFLFLNRSSFNGLLRFNRNGKYNVPFGHKPKRFSQSYITKITNQIEYVQKAIKIYNWEFVCKDFRQTLNLISKDDIVYCDPPYFGRHVDYYNSWTELDEDDLINMLNNNKFNYILSTWHSNKFRDNSQISKFNESSTIITKEHFYHIGAKEENRNSMLEALVMNFNRNTETISKPNTFISKQLQLF
ncbi:MAG TPA: Dam family site-specific DNA-(adenine-N6)-methyltransferase [Candidatus Kapabacteria bacterium]|nr:Dam family site-specific DNA-(adenine-N6)-methyltransferase [Candidatus Kapabacteria bacterium]HPO62102.1 Dam family site-specific DNA-(adenine-N6)-methyltransferase [Candidatus Kapabacteria bacterium]